MPTPRFIVIEKDPFIARDMETGLRAACSLCEVLTVPDLPAATHLSAQQPGRSVFITGARLAVIDDSGLAAYAAARGDLIVVRQGADSDDSVRARGYMSLSAPFTDADLAALARVMLVRAARLESPLI